MGGWMVSGDPMKRVRRSNAVIFALAAGLVGAACSTSATEAGGSAITADAGAHDSGARETGTRAQIEASDPPCLDGCSPVYAYPKDPTRSCIDMTRIELIGCECSSSAIGAVERCQHRVADGSLWAIGATRFDQGAEWTDCTTDEALLVQSSCEFSECERPPPSFCTLSQTCHELGCNTWEFDAHACRRKDCQHDEECPADERCTAVPGCLNNFSCWSENGQCGCGGPEPCNMGYLCNPVATAGPRGTWSRFEIVQGAGPCPPGGSCTWDWVVTPDGEVTSSKQGDAGAQMILDPWRLRMALDGPEFRLGMQNGFQCDLPPTDVSVTFKVVIDGVSIQQDVTGCAISGPADNVAQALFDMLKNY